jgi:hypothetical protein
MSQGSKGGSSGLIALAACRQHLPRGSSLGGLRTMAPIRALPSSWAGIRKPSHERHCASQETVTDAALVQRDKRVCRYGFSPRSTRKRHPRAGVLRK